MTSSLLRRCAALAPILSWTLVAPASPRPTAATALTAPSERTTLTAAASAATLTPPESAAPYLASVAPPSTAVEATPEPVVHPWRRLLKREVTPAVVARANAIIRRHAVIGDEVPFTVAGETFLARIEEHYHPPGGDKFPWGPHPGVSVFTARPPAAP